MSTPSHPWEWKGGARGTLNAHVSGTPNGPWTYSLFARTPAFAHNGHLHENTLQLTELHLPEVDWRQLAGRRYAGLVPAGHCVTAHGYHERVDVRSIEFGLWDGLVTTITCVCECDFGGRNAALQELVAFTAHVEFTGVSVGTERWVWTPNPRQHETLARLTARGDVGGARVVRHQMRSHDALLLATQAHDHLASYRPHVTPDARPWFVPQIR